MPPTVTLTLLCRSQCHPFTCLQRLWSLFTMAWLPFIWHCWTCSSLWSCRMSRWNLVIRIHSVLWVCVCYLHGWVGINNCDHLGVCRSVCVLALQRSHPGRGHGMPLRRSPVLRATCRGRVLLRHVDGGVCAIFLSLCTAPFFSGIGLHSPLPPPLPTPTPPHTLSTPHLSPPLFKYFF